jgi:hypothetical protein
MKKLTLAEVSSLVKGRRGPCVSVFITAGKQGLWAPRTLRRYRHLLDTAASKLERLQTAINTADILEPLRLYTSLQAEVEGHCRALACFATPGFAGYFPVPASTSDQRLPQQGPTDDLCIVGDRFHLTPISDFINPMRGWFLVKLTKGGLQLYRGQGPALEELSQLEWPDHPRVQSLLQRNPGSRNPEQARYVRFSSADHMLLDEHISAHLSETDRPLPLLLCGTKTDMESYLRESEHAFEAVIPLSERYRERTSDGLLTLAWPRVAEHFEQDWRMAIAGLSHALKTGLSTCDPHQIARRLNAGLLKLLAISAEQGRAALPEDLIHRAMELGCKVFLCQPDEMPHGAPILAM